MGFRVIFIENEVHMSFKLNNLIVEKEGGEVWIPLDDISMIVVDNLHITITARMLSIIAEHNIGLIICNQEHLPIGMYGSYDNHSRISKTIKFQIEQPQEFYDSLWRKLIVQKIFNQQKVLKRINLSSDSQTKLEQLKAEVTDGDASNREAHAAKIYFNTLMGCTFSRGNEEILLNSGLDYGYSIIRSFIARACVGYGLNTQIGIHHKNEYNRFNLVDDLIEPIRPFVDIYAYNLLKDEEYFKPEHRHRLVNLLNHKVRYNSRNMYFSNMLEEYTEQYSSYLSNNRKDIIMPDVDGYDMPFDETWEMATDEI